MRELTAASSLSRRALLPRPSGAVTVTLSSRFIAGAVPGRISLIVGTRYHCLRGMIRHTLLDYSIEVTFELAASDPSGTSEITDANIHPRIMTIMYGTAIGALRGMLAMRLENTWLSDFPLPLVNISALVSHRIYGTRPSGKAIPLVDFVYN